MEDEIHRVLERTCLISSHVFLKLDVVQNNAVSVHISIKPVFPLLHFCFNFIFCRGNLIWDPRIKAAISFIV